jgi:hypothetical protein
MTTTSPQAEHKSVGDAKPSTASAAAGGETKSDSSTEADELDGRPCEDLDDETHERQIKLFQEPSQINDYLFLGSARQAANRAFLTKHNVTHILCVHTSMRLSSGFVQKHVPLSDYGEPAQCAFLRHLLDF